MGCSGSRIAATVATTNTNTDAGNRHQTALTCSTNGQRQERTQKHSQNSQQTGYQYPQTGNVQQTGYQYPQTSNTQQTGYQYPQTSNFQQTGYQYPQTSNIQQTGYQYPQTSNVQQTGFQYPQTNNIQQTGYQYPQTGNIQQTGYQYPQTSHIQQTGFQHPQTSNIHQIHPPENGAPTERTITEDDKEKEQETFLKLLPYSRRQISRHNYDQGWVEWGVFGKRIYDCSKIRNNTTFQNMILQRKREHYPSLHLDFADEDTWKKNAPLLMHIVGFSKAEIHTALSPYVMGRVEEVQLSEFWSDVREDVTGLEQELSGAEDISPYQHELLEQVQRWLATYRHIDPGDSGYRQGDPNGLPFPLPEGTAHKPEVLRIWIIEWEQFDTTDAELPLAELTELSDKTDDTETHGVFALTLRQYDATEDLKFDDPEWEMLPTDVIANDVTTPRQDEINQQRDKRLDLHDTTRMSSRRRKLAQYFIVKYKWQTEKLSSYLQWADEMKEGELRFAALLEQS